MWRREDASRQTPPTVDPQGDRSYRSASPAFVLALRDNIRNREQKEPIREERTLAAIALAGTRETTRSPHPGDAGDSDSRVRSGRADTKRRIADADWQSSMHT